jgi:aconitate hydratase
VASASPRRATGTAVPFEVRGHKGEIGHGAVVIAAITSCTNTSNPSVMLAAGLLARKAVRRGLRFPPTSRRASPRGPRW